jgi:hypothetical protein
MCKYNDVDIKNRKTPKQLKKILKTGVSKRFEQRTNQWNKCIRSQGDYFEGDQSTIFASLLL